MTKQPQEEPQRNDDAFLVPYFFDASAIPAEDLPDALQARLLHDAMAFLPVAPQIHARRPGLIARLGEGIARLGWQPARLLGAAPGVAVVCTAGLAGVWIGVAAPGPALDLLGYIAPSASVFADDGSVWAQAAQDLGDDEALLALLDSF